MATVTNPFTGATYNTSGNYATGFNVTQTGAGTGTVSDAGAGTKTVTPAMSVAEAKQQAEQAFSGIVTPMTLEDIRTREKEAQAVTSQVAESVYNPQIQRAEETGAAQVSTAQGVVGQRQGFNISTAELAFVDDTTKKVEDRIKAVENQKASYISQGNLEAANRADDSIAKLTEFQNNLAIAKANYALQLMAGNREQAQLELEQAKQKAQETQFQKTLDISEMELLSKIPEGKTVTYNGKTYTGIKPIEVEPFFKGSDIVSLMKELPSGTSKTLTDPNTKQNYTIIGTSQSGVVLKESTDNAGNVIYQTVDITSGKPKIIGQVSGGRIGKSGSAGTSVNVSMASQKMPIRSEIYNPGTNQLIGYVAYNDLTKKMEFFTPQGQSTSAPKAYSVSPTTNPEQSLDDFINKIK